MTENNIDPLNIKELLSQDEYRIPIYQRNYDWGKQNRFNYWKISLIMQP